MENGFYTNDSQCGWCDGWTNTTKVTGSNGYNKWTSHFTCGECGYETKTKWYGGNTRTQTIKDGK